MRIASKLGNAAVRREDATYVTLSRRGLRFAAASSAATDSAQSYVCPGVADRREHPRRALPAFEARAGNLFVLDNCDRGRADLRKGIGCRGVPVHGPNGLFGS